MKGATFLMIAAVFAMGVAAPAVAFDKDTKKGVGAVSKGAKKLGESIGKSGEAQKKAAKASESENKKREAADKMLAAFKAAKTEADKRKAAKALRLVYGYHRVEDIDGFHLETHYVPPAGAVKRTERGDGYHVDTHTDLSHLPLVKEDVDGYHVEYRRDYSAALTYSDVEMTDGKGNVVSLPLKWLKD